ncbi:17727_t:CDS:2 [Acaulospora morrowiae]|uniref:17727_t:CDS:1 n=1 Tax=Acaulospora morrowiae TaxID=94023 RepID=A0A9N9EHN4_9GLOM|nr:17727_t:CDS:2 [Acaulospora morrowiae]
MPAAVINPSSMDLSMNKPVPDSLIDYASTSVRSILHVKSTLPSHKSLQPYLPDLLIFIKKLITDLELPVLTIIVCLIYVHRFKKALPKNYRTEYGTAHRIFVSSVLVASKYIDDQPLTSRRVVESVGWDVWSIKEVNRMERTFLNSLKWNLSVDRESLCSYLTELRENQHIEL